MNQPIRRRRAAGTPEPTETKAAAPSRRRPVIPITPVTPARRGPIRAAGASAPTPTPPPSEADTTQEDIQQDKVIVARYMDRIHNPMTAIRARCIQCCNGQPKEVSLCPATGCALHQFRMGKNPFHKRTGTTKAGATTDEGNEDDDS